MLEGPQRKLRKSSNRMIGGVCAGIAEYLRVPPLLVRVVFIATTLALAIFPGLLLYGVLWALLPPAWPPS
jgi:phage shock protein C